MTWAIIESVDVPAARATVRDRGVAVTAPILGGDYLAGDVVQLQYGAAGDVVILGRVGDAQPPAPIEKPRPDEPAAASPIPLGLTPTAVGSWRADTGWAAGTIGQGDWGWGLRFGAAYYGTALHQLAPDMTQPRYASVALTRTYGGQHVPLAPTVHLLPASAPGAGMPASTTSLTIETPIAIGQTVHWPLPQDWVDTLLSGTAGGLGVYVGTAHPYINFDPAGAADQFALSLTYYPQG